MDKPDEAQNPEEIPETPAPETENESETEPERPPEPEAEEERRSASPSATPEPEEEEVSEGAESTAFKIPFVEIGLVAWVVLTFVLYVWRFPYIREPLDLVFSLLSDIPVGLRILFTGEMAIFDAPADFWWDVGRAVLGNLVYFLIGFWYISRRNIEMPNWSWIPVSYVLGLGLLTIPLEILAIFNLLSFASIAGTIVIVFALIFFLTKEELLDTRKRRRLRRPRAVLAFANPFEAAVWWVGLVLIVLISFYTFYYAVFLPVIYVDSLMYYVDYGHRTFLQGGFPVHVTAQVGIGLGANYPHLYPLAQATQAGLFGHYTDIYAQFIPPLCGVLSTWLIYLLLLERIGNRACAMAGALVFRSVPYVLSYFVWTSDYALTMLFTTVFFYAALQFLKDRNKPSLEIMMLTVAVAPHINYLMWVLFAPFLLYLFAKPGTGQGYGFSMFSARHREQIFEVPPVWVIVFIIGAVLLASPWYIRNIAVTGNPVYAFFPEIFGGIRINMEVLESAFQEWRSNGDGIGVWPYELAQSFWGRLALTPLYLMWEPSSQHKLAPLLVIFGIPGIILALRKGSVFGLGAVLLTAILWAYECYSGLYLYQVIMIVIPMAVVASLVFIDVLRLRAVLLCVCLLLGILGLGFSISSTGKTTKLNTEFLDLRVAGDDDFLFLDQAYQYVDPRLGPHNRGDGDLFRYLRDELADTAILTHENRRHYFPADVGMVHLDDWDVQALYDLPLADVVAGLRELGVEYYLYVPNEENHPITGSLGIGGREADPEFFELVKTFGAIPTADGFVPHYLLFRIR